jgi:hypothetical protein
MNPPSKAVAAEHAGAVEPAAANASTIRFLVGRCGFTQ